MLTKNSVLIFLCAIAGASVLINLHKQKTIYAWTLSNSDAMTLLEPAVANTPPKIVIGSVSCRNKLVPSTDYNNYTITMLKSVIMSAQRDHIPEVDIHLFVEHLDTDADYIKHYVLTGHKFKNSAPIKVTVFTYSAVDLIPEKYRNTMIFNDNRYRCGFVRMFFPLALPKVDSLLYMDSDIVVTGSILKLWQELGRMKGSQIIGVSRVRSVQNNRYLHLDKVYAGLPHVLPKAVASGLLVMNLTRMRELEWEQKFMQVLKDYSKQTKMTDQTALNIMLFRNPSIYQIIPCHLHFLMYECHKEWFCMEADEDSQGVHSIHGYSGLFHKGNFWGELYSVFERFNVSSTDEDFFEDVAIPLREFYSTPNSNNLCYGTINRTLFKEYFVKYK